MKMPSKIILSFSTIGALIAILIFSAFFSFKLVQKESQNLIAAKDQLAISQFKMAELEKFKGIQVREQDNFAKIDKLFVNQTAPVNFIEFLESEAANSKLSLDIIPFLSPQDKSEAWPSLSFELDLQGNPSNFMQFLEKLEKAPYLIRIVNFNFAKSSKSNFEANISLKVYFQ